ncbi:nitrous oxide reductase family maturation protein NosD, partial [Neisseria sp. P0001.S004]
MIMTHTPSHRSKWQRAAFVLLLGSMVQTAFAAVINVSAQDNLNDALARAQAGDTLKLASGTYKTKL